MPLVGFILIAMAAASVGAVLYMVLREPQEQEVWYIPPDADEIAHRGDGGPDTEAVAESFGVPMVSASPVLDEEMKRQAKENRK